MTDLLQRLRVRLAETSDPVFAEMLRERIEELSKSTKSPYEQVYGQLDAAYADLRNGYDYDAKFRKRWDTSRHRILHQHNWTEDSFYAEMDRRRLGG